MPYKSAYLKRIIACKNIRAAVAIPSLIVRCFFIENKNSSLK
jgi:hypothetical protein